MGYDGHDDLSSLAVGFRDVMDRRIFLSGLTSLGACSDGRFGLSGKPHQKRMAITMDDFLLDFNISLDREARHANILSAFDAVGHKAAGFVTGSFVTSDWGQRVVQDWLDAGHLIANHTWTHPCLLYTSPSPRDKRQSRMPSSA